MPTKLTLFTVWRGAGDGSVTFLSAHQCHMAVTPAYYLMRTDRTIFKSVMPSMIFAVPSILRCMPSKALARSIPYHCHPLAQRGRDAGLAAR